MQLAHAEILEWLRLEGRSRNWLAQQLGVKISAVGNWFGKVERPIPAKHFDKIRDLMRRDMEDRQKRATDTRKLVIYLDGDESEALAKNPDEQKGSLISVLNQLGDLSDEDIAILSQKITNQPTEV